MYQPGERWLYNVSDDVLGVLVARVTGQSFEAFLRERIFGPLGMKDTSTCPLTRSTGCRPCTPPIRRPGSSRWRTRPKGGHHSKPPAFQSGGGGLDSTVDDYHACFRMLLHHGLHGTERILSRPTVEPMTTDRLTPEQTAALQTWARSVVHLSHGQGQTGGWGFGMTVRTAATTRPSGSSAGTAEPAPRRTPTRTTSSSASCSPRQGCPPRTRRGPCRTSGPPSTRPSTTDLPRRRTAPAQGGSAPRRTFRTHRPAHQSETPPARGGP